MITNWGVYMGQCAIWVGGRKGVRQEEARRGSERGGVKER